MSEEFVTRKHKPLIKLLNSAYSKHASVLSIATEERWNVLFIVELLKGSPKVCNRK